MLGRKFSHKCSFSAIENQSLKFLLLTGMVTINLCEFYYMIAIKNELTNLDRYKYRLV